jgi:hypothetical protein
VRTTAPMGRRPQSLCVSGYVPTHVKSIVDPQIKG